MQELRQYEKQLKDEINQLRAQKASLLSLERVEDIVIHKLGYQYPEPEQLIKVVEE
jgi:cell division protein FtsL